MLGHVSTGEKLQSVIDQSQVNKQTSVSHVELNRRFVMDNFSRLKRMNNSGSWKSPAMYTHVRRYKFCVEVEANVSSMSGSGVDVSILSVSGEFDEELKWPVIVAYTIEVINQRGGQNAKYSRDRMTWDKPSMSLGVTFKQYRGRFYHPCLFHGDLLNFLLDDALHFEVSKIEILPNSF